MCAVTDYLPHMARPQAYWLRWETCALARVSRHFRLSFEPPAPTLSKLRTCSSRMRLQISAHWYSGQSAQ